MSMLTRCIAAHGIIMLYLANDAVLVGIQRQLFCLPTLPLDTSSFDRLAICPSELELNGCIGSKSQTSEEAFLQQATG